MRFRVVTTWLWFQEIGNTLQTFSINSQDHGVHQWAGFLCFVVEWNIGCLVISACVSGSKFSGPLRGRSKFVPAIARRAGWKLQVRGHCGAAQRAWRQRNSRPGWRNLDAPPTRILGRNATPNPPFPLSWNQAPRDSVWASWIKAVRVHVGNGENVKTTSLRGASLNEASTSRQVQQNQPATLGRDAWKRR